MEDLISRQAAIDVIYDNEYKKDMRKALEKLPSVTPKPKMGRWIDDKCSECGKGIEDLIDSPEWYRNEQPNFCPFCGVKMQEVEE